MEYVLLYKICGYLTRISQKSLDIKKIFVRLMMLMMMKKHDEEYDKTTMTQNKKNRADGNLTYVFQLKPGYIKIFRINAHSLCFLVTHCASFTCS